MSTLKLNNKNVKKGSGENVTHVDSLHIKRGKTLSKNTPIVLCYGKSGSNIPRAHCVSDQSGVLDYASCSISSTECVGVCFTNCLANEKLCYITSGIITDDQYAFSAPFGRPVWLSPAGLPTDVLPTNGYLQRLGVTINETTFLLKIDRKINRSTTTTTSLQIDAQVYYDIVTKTFSYSIANSQPSVNLFLHMHEQNLPSSTWEVPVVGTVGHVSVYRAADEGYSSADDAIMTLSNGSITVQFEEPAVGIVVYTTL